MAALPNTLHNDCDDNSTEHNIQNEEQMDPETNLHPIPPM